MALLDNVGDVGTLLKPAWYHSLVRYSCLQSDADAMDAHGSRLPLVPSPTLVHPASINHAQFG